MTRVPGYALVTAVQGSDQRRSDVTPSPPPGIKALQDRSAEITLLAPAHTSAANTYSLPSLRIRMFIASNCTETKTRILMVDPQPRSTCPSHRVYLV